MTADGNGMTNKELLLRIDARVEALHSKVEDLNTAFRVHEKGMHPETEGAIHEMRAEVQRNRLTMAKWSGGLAVLIILASWIVPQIVSRL